jgi:hypothetical protein
LAAVRRCLDALTATPDDVYAFTHTLMYETDLGTRQVELPRPRVGIETEAEAALAWCLDEQDYDLAGEVLLTWPLLGWSWSSSAAFGFRCLTRVEDEAGFLPSPTISLARLRQLDGTDRSRYALAMTYHTVYVMGLLCALTLRSDQPVPAKPTGAPHCRGAAEALLAASATGLDGRHWQSTLEELSPSQRDSIAPLLLTIYLRRAVRRRNLKEVQELLRVAAPHGLLQTPAARQALDLLERTSLLGRLGLISSVPADTS